MKIGEKIKKIRELRNFTQAHMSDALSMTQAGYSKIERDEVDIPFSRLEKIAQVLKMNVQEIVGFDDNRIFGNQLNNYHNITNGFIVSNDDYIKELRKQYEHRITDLQAENKRLHALLEKSFTQ